MGTSKFKDALDHTLRFEGGYVNDPRDPGGETNFGITKKVAEKNGYTGPMRAIPMPLVQSIYKTKYWDAIRGDELPQALSLSLFDLAVNSGVSRAIRMLQAVLGLDQDGVLGPKTLFMASTVDPKRTALAVLDRRLSFLKRLRTWPTFGRGWQRRVDELKQIILQM